MSVEIIRALEELEAEKGIMKSYMLDRISQGMIAAYKALFKKDPYNAPTDNVEATIDPETGVISVFVTKVVVDDEPENYSTEITVEDAMNYTPNPQLGDAIKIEVDTKDFSRIATQTAKQVIIQGIREAERGMVLAAFSSKEHEILSATVIKIDARYGNMVLEIGGGKDKTEVMMQASEQVRGEVIKEGDVIKVYVAEVRNGAKGPQIVISRTHPGLVKRLFELEVPEIYDGTVVINGVAREAGSRSKIAVFATDENVDPVGACVGPRGSRVGNIVNELRGEKIDIIRYSEDPAKFVAEALSPSEVISVTMHEDGKSCTVIVPDTQLSLAIGKEGQNARLAAKLTGLKIDIKPQSQAQ
ncbi:MAG: transcription termination/antitermination protein NusA [Clostridia bacterium]|nr:transcription termination/antitermination protein NusA [Clostridia bacterium]MBQ7092909.1 transcription termination/antitermination protein NusA [Clostridia bacterium]